MDMEDIKYLKEDVYEMMKETDEEKRKDMAYSITSSMGREVDSTDYVPDLKKLQDWMQYIPDIANEHNPISREQMGDELLGKMESAILDKGKIRRKNLNKILAKMKPNESMAFVIPSTNPKGWHKEPINHALASKGIKVGKNRAKR
jgi:hypothetical protein